MAAKPKDITGQRFGMLVAVRDTGETKYRTHVWECKCDCGRTIYECVRNLQWKRSCGCDAHKAKDITGRRFGRLVAIRDTGEIKHHSHVWECKCDCGNVVYESVSVLNQGHKQSCGCLWVESINTKGRNRGPRLPDGQRPKGKRFVVELPDDIAQWLEDTGKTVTDVIQAAYEDAKGAENEKE